MRGLIMRFNSTYFHYLDALFVIFNFSRIKQAILKFDPNFPPLMSSKVPKRICFVNIGNINAMGLRRLSGLAILIS